MYNPVFPSLSFFLKIFIILLFVFFSFVKLIISKELNNFRDKFILNEILPGAEILVLELGNPPFAKAYRDNRLVGYVYLNTSIIDTTTGYSGKPIYIVIGMDTNGLLTGAKIVEHSEPIVMAGISIKKINALINNYKNTNMYDIENYNEKNYEVDFVSGATITSMIIDESIIKSSIEILKNISSKKLKLDLHIDQQEIISLKKIPKKIENWKTMINNGSISRKILSVGTISTAFKKAGKITAAKNPETDKPEDIFIDLFIASASISNIALSLLGEQEYKNLQEILKPGQSAILMASNGIYSYKGSGYVRGGIFDRFQLIQDDISVRFTDKQHKRLGNFMAKGSPIFKDIDLFIIPSEKIFNPAKAWSIQLLIHRYIGPIKKEFITSNIKYIPPEKFISRKIITVTKNNINKDYVNDINKNQMWIIIWKSKINDIFILTIAIGILTIIFFSQDFLVKKQILINRIRLIFLIFTVFWIGFYQQAQLSIINVLTFCRSLIYDFKWEFFLLEPLIFILWCSVVASLLFWGRGVYCGWLCPFGALQEILNRIAKLIKIRQINIPWWLHERLWPIKYLIFLLLFGVSLYSFERAEELAEVEPFKTTIILSFMRSWPYVAYTSILLIIGLFIERFFCRYLCPLGGALGIPGRMRMNEWLRRRKECGFPCHRCAKECTVHAIHPNGQINPNECIQCLHCQTLYYDNFGCPPLIEKRERREIRRQKSIQAK